MVSAARVAEGVKDSNDCPMLPQEAKADPDRYMRP